MRILTVLGALFQLYHSVILNPLITNWRRGALLLQMECKVNPACAEANYCACVVYPTSLNPDSPQSRRKAAQAGNTKVLLNWVS